MTRPSRNRRAAGTVASTAAPGTTSGARHVDHASHARYTAPAMRIVSYASGTAARIADSPNAAASTCSRKPLDVPASDTKPAARPCASVRDTR